MHDVLATSAALLKMQLVDRSRPHPFLVHDTLPGFLEDKDYHLGAVRKLGEKGIFGSLIGSLGLRDLSLSGAAHNTLEALNYLARNARTVGKRHLRIVSINGWSWQDQPFYVSGVRILRKASYASSL